MQKLIVTIALGMILRSLIGVGHAQAPQPPEDSSKFHLAVFTTDGWKSNPNETDLLEFFDRDPTLAELKRRCHWHHYTVGDKLYQSRFARYISANQFPAVWLQRPDGGIVYKASGHNVPKSADKMVSEIDYFWKLDPYTLKSQPTAPDSSDLLRGQLGSNPNDPLCPDGRCPVPNPNQPYQPQPYQPQPYPNLTPYVDPLALPDSASIFNRSGGVLQWDAPIRKAMAVLIWLFGGIAALFVAVMLLAVVVFVFGMFYLLIRRP